MRPDLDRLMSAGLSGSAMSVYLAIATRSADGPTEISDQELSELTKRPARTVRRARGKLAEAGLVAQIPQPGRPALLSLSHAGQSGHSGYTGVAETPAKSGQGRAGTPATHGRTTPARNVRGVASSGQGTPAKSGQGQPAPRPKVAALPLIGVKESGESGRSSCSSSKTTTTTLPPLPSSNKTPIEPLGPELLAEIYNQHRGVLPPVTLLPQTADWILADCLIESWRDGWREELEDWILAIQRAQEIPFCRGEGPSGWRVTFQWLVKDRANFRKILDGLYDRELPAKRPPVRSDGESDYVWQPDPELQERIRRYSRNDWWRASGARAQGDPLQGS